MSRMSNVLGEPSVLMSSVPASARTWNSLDARSPAPPFSVSTPVLLSTLKASWPPPPWSVTVPSVLTSDATLRSADTAIDRTSPGPAPAPPVNTAATPSTSSDRPKRASRWAWTAIVSPSPYVGSWLRLRRNCPSK